MSERDRPAPEQDAKGRFIAGNSGNGGRPKGSRNKLGEAFVNDLYAAWQDKGKLAIDAVIAERPQDFLKVVAGLLPKEVKITSELDELADDELASVLAALRAITDSGGVAKAGGRAGQEEGEESAKGLRPLH